MAKIVDNRICSRCNKEYTWDCLIPDDHKAGYLEAYEVIEGNVRASCLNPIRSTSVYNFRAICPHCRQYDSFSYDNPNKVAL